VSDNDHNDSINWSFDRTLHNVQTLQQSARLTRGHIYVIPMYAGSLVPAVIGSLRPSSIHSEIINQKRIDPGQAIWWNLMAEDYLGCALRCVFFIISLAPSLWSLISAQRKHMWKTECVKFTPQPHEIRISLPKMVKFLFTQWCENTVKLSAPKAKYMKNRFHSKHGECTFSHTLSGAWDKVHNSVHQYQIFTQYIICDWNC
jgi:hypothetical protein